MTSTDPEEEPSGATTHPKGGAGTGPPTRDTDHAVEKRALTAHDAARALSIPYRTLLDAIHKDQIGAVKIGRYYQVPVEEIDRLLAPAIKTTAA
jgi:excisionase family DNA binding protein